MSIASIRVDECRIGTSLFEYAVVVTFGGLIDWETFICIMQQ